MRSFRKLFFPLVIGYAIAWALLTVVTFDPGALARGATVDRFFFLLFGVLPGLMVAWHIDELDMRLSEEEKKAKDEAFLHGPRKLLEFLWRGGCE